MQVFNKNISAGIEKLKNKGYKTLRNSERFFKTDMIYLAKGGFWLISGKFITALIAFGLAVAFANLLPQEVFGEYKFIFSIFGLLAIPTLVGMGAAVTKATAQGYDGTVRKALKTKILWGVLGSTASILVAGYYYFQGNISLAGAFAIVALFIPFVETFGIFNSILKGKKLFKVAVFYSMIVQVSSASIIVGTLFFTNNLLIILVNYFIAYTVIRFFVYKIVLSKYTTNKKNDYSAITYGKHLSLMRVLGTVSDTAESILLWHFLGAAPLAIYSFAKAIPMQMKSVLKKIPILAFPKFATRNLEEIKKPLIGKMLKMFLVLLVVVSLYIAAAPFIYNIFFPQYTDSIFFSQVFALTLLFAPAALMHTTLEAHGKKKELYIVSTTMPIVKLVLIIVLIPLFGIMGVIISIMSIKILGTLLLSILLIYARSDFKEAGKR